MIRAGVGVRAGVYGATGYTGIELLRLLARHPDASLAFATSREHAGRRLSAVFDGAPEPDVRLVDPSEADPSSVDVVFLCLPHGAAAETAVLAVDAGTRVIDLSADFRLRDPAAYAEWYGQPHPAPERLAEAVYGLVEHARERLPGARLVANPGCYPTSVLLPLLPLVSAGAVEARATIIADSKSGVSGAGRGPKLHTSFAELHDNFHPYAVGRAHRHLPEMEQALEAAASGALDLAAPVLEPAVAARRAAEPSATRAAEPSPTRAAEPSATRVAAPRLLFTPHLLPVTRGILSTLYVPLAEGWDGAAARAALEASYRDEPFVRVLPDGDRASLAHVVHTNRAVMSLHPVDDGPTAVDGAASGGGGEAGVRSRTTLIVASAIDNLVKGAAGQAVQNMNVMLGLDETAGLT